MSFVNDPQKQINVYSTFKIILQVCESANEILISNIDRSRIIRTLFTQFSEYLNPRRINMRSCQNFLELILITEDHFKTVKYMK